ncbi:hypothetical protein DM02DRAFT_546924, partial [Periconia macrospinosa]
NPVLIGANLKNFYFPGKPKEPKSHYMVLHTGDMSGKVECYKELLFQSLWEERKYNEKKGEIKFPWGITLNVSEPLHASGEFLRLNRRSLRRVFSFHERQLQSQYSFFRDKQIKNLQAPQIIGIGGTVSTLKALAPGYALSLFQFEEKIQFLFQRAGGRPLRATAWEDGIHSPITAFGYIQGPITAFGYW